MIGYPLQYSWASLVAQLVKNPAMQETWVWSLGWEDSPREGNGYSLQYSWPGKSHGQRNLADYSSRGCKESDRTERLTLSFSFLLVVQSPSHIWLFATPWTAACKTSLSITNSRSLLKLMSIELVMPSHPLSSPSPPAFNLSQHQILSN